MRTVTLTLLALTILGPTAAAAGPPDFPRIRSLFERKKKDDDAPSKAKPLLETLKGDTDEKKRKAAAESLGDLDPRANPDIVTGLITSLRQDPAVAVRTTAAESLGKLKPVSAQAGVALEEAGQSDPAEGVRKAAQAALFQYHLNGYKGNPGGSVQSAEPPLAGRVKPAAPVTVSRGQPTRPQTQEPPLAKPKTTPAPTAPSGPTVSPPPEVKSPGIPTVTPPPLPMNGVPTIPVPKG